MKERPILFSAPMVRAILDGSKTQTRRVVKPQPIYDGKFAGGWKVVGKNGHEAATCGPLVSELCPYGQPGDRLWVRETWAAPHSEDGRPPRAIQCDQLRIHYLASEGRGGLVWRPSIHMPRWASRITLEITGVRVERLQEISEADAIAEGIERSYDQWRDYRTDQAVNYPSAATPIDSYRTLWEEINGQGSWDANPWVWVVEFKRLEVA